MVQEIQGKKIHIVFGLRWDEYLTSHHCVVDRMIFIKISKSVSEVSQPG